jgi:diaminohydroxyphosphoribosylaminopyrimidine deaminase/5-amino-6-(5-phosphoribosylamino)uracil reductase
MGEEAAQISYNSVRVTWRTRARMESYLAYQMMAPRLSGAIFREVSKISDSEPFMARAFEEARKGAGNTWTNPLVGAVIVKNGRILATGYHHHFGQMHAEVNALSHLRNVADARGATMYVTLEPCSHYGKTPPCARKLVDVGIRKVVIGQQDPNPLVSGKGIAILRQGGIDVEVHEDTGGINQAYNFFYRHHRPLITVKYAMSLDGKVNSIMGRRTLLTGKTAYRDSQHLRATHQAILIGQSTFLIDNPALTVRTQQVSFPPIRIILVDDADMVDQEAQIFQTETPVWLLSRQPSHREWPAFVRVFEAADWAPEDVMKLLADHGVQSVMVEGGSHVQARFVAAGLVDRMIIYLAPQVLGGHGLPAVWGQASDNVKKLKITAIQQLADDLRIEARRI